MKKNDAPERAAALIHQAVDVLQRARHAPASPISAFTPAKVRRQMRRNAARLRAGEVLPRHPNIIHSNEELADVLERTARRDEIFEQGNEEFRRISLELEGIFEKNDPAVMEAIKALLLDAIGAAERGGPGSDAAERFQQMLHLAWLGRHALTRRRRQRDLPVPRPILPPRGDVDVQKEENGCSGALIFVDGCDARGGGE